MSGRGRCLCAAIAFAYEGAENWCTHCHCESCRRQTSSAFTTFVSVPKAGLVWTRGEPAAYASSPKVRRLFCRDCGSPLAYENDDYPGESHLYLAALDARPDGPTPGRHDFWSERVTWVELCDELPKKD